MNFFWSFIIMDWREFKLIFLSDAKQTKKPKADENLKAQEDTSLEAWRLRACYAAEQLTHLNLSRG